MELSWSLQDFNVKPHKLKVKWTQEAEVNINLYKAFNDENFNLVKAEIMEQLLAPQKAMFIGEARLLMQGAHLQLIDLGFIEKPEELKKMTTVFDMYDDRVALKEWARSEILKEIVDIEGNGSYVG